MQTVRGGGEAKECEESTAVTTERLDTGKQITKATMSKSVTGSDFLMRQIAWCLHAIRVGTHLKIIGI